MQAIQWGFDALFTLIVFLGGWILGTLWKEIKDARDDHAKLTAILPETYARRDDTKDQFSQVMAALVRIETKLDSKADK